MSNLYYQVYGHRGPYLLLLHGMLSSRAQWINNLPALAEHTRPVVVELWGHGRSPSPADPALYSPDAYIAQLEAIRKALNIEQWFICGQSFGACITLRYALTYPERVPAQIFTNSTSALATAEKVKEIYVDVNKLTAKLVKNGKAGLKRMQIHPIHAKRLPAEAHEALLADAELLDPEGVARLFQYTTPFASVAEIVAGTKVPTLLITGEQETRFAPHRRYAETHIPGLRVVGIDGGHAANIERPEAFNAAVLDFIRENS